MSFHHEGCMRDKAEGAGAQSRKPLPRRAPGLFALSRRGEAGDYDPLQRGRPAGVEPAPRRSRPLVLPLHHGRHFQRTDGCVKPKKERTPALAAERGSSKRGLRLAGPFKWDLPCSAGSCAPISAARLDGRATRSRRRAAPLVFLHRSSGLIACSVQKKCHGSSGKDFPAVTPVV